MKTIKTNVFTVMSKIKTIQQTLKTNVFIMYSCCGVSIHCKSNGVHGLYCRNFPQKRKHNGFYGFQDTLKLTLIRPLQECPENHENHTKSQTNRSKSPAGTDLRFSHPSPQGWQAMGTPQGGHGHHAALARDGHAPRFRPRDA